ncbi:MULTISPECIES: RidA family protein [unclassified Arthrobacter]|uniref:RidA family protein n=1 Tax=unclassified Arthrobacter TaxID=235627 RepID=UPI00159D565F|nr:RidA family protein [Arthrobacter sp. STN4]MCQ9165872.1 RidA family protein [Arthrobacter sp. STN4]NVM99893.1 RidA family protein [Arthrobacter sp. SDTb3-6]
MDNKNEQWPLPPIPVPAGNYVPVQETHGLLLTSGHTSAVQGVLVHRGRVGEDLTVEEGRSAAATAVLNCLASLSAHVGGLDRIREIVSMTGYVCAGSDFADHPLVMDGASEVLASYFGERGHPVRAAIGVSSLPGGAPVEISLVATVRSE